MVKSAISGPRGGRYEANRSVRMSDELFASLQAKAKSDGQTASAALKMLAEGYVRGAYALPKMQLVYSQPSGQSK